ncbi:MAG: hypothetical protein ACLFP9_01180 [Desulfonatronovibrio sp.]
MNRKTMLLAFLLVFLTGCSYLSVKHLDKNLFELNQTGELSMRYWDLEYVGTVENGEYLVSGVALPKTDAVPGWGEWLHEFWLAAYLSDENGVVLAKDMHVFPTQKLDPEKGVKFEFNMSPETMPSDRNIFLTFGYRMSLTQGRYDVPRHEDPLTGEQSVFFASEGALAR